MINHKNQNAALVQYITNNTHITSWTAFDKLGIVSLPKRICELKEAGLDIGKDWIEGKNRYGNVCRVRRYWLER